MRKKAQSLKVSEWLQEHLASIEQKASVVDLYQVKLPMFDGGETKAQNINKLLSDFDKADSFVFVSPEWNGMMSHGLLNLMHYIGHQMADKPVMLVGVSSARGGSYPIAQMRLIGYKNNHYVITPESLIVQGVNDVFNNHSFGKKEADLYIKKRADYALRVLVEYSEALKTVRKSGVIKLDNYPNGM